MSGGIKVVTTAIVICDYQHESYRNLTTVERLSSAQYTFSNNALYREILDLS